MGLKVKLGEFSFGLETSLSLPIIPWAIFDKAARRRGRRSGTAAPQQGASAARSSSKTIGGAAVAGEEDSGEESSPQCLEHFDLFLVYLEHFNLYDGLMEHCRVRWVRRLAPSRSCEEAATSGTAAGCDATAGAGRIGAIYPGKLAHLIPEPLRHNIS